MISLWQRAVSIFVERASQQWIVRDEDGALGIVPAMPDGWEHRVPFTPTDATELELVPGHDRYLLGLPVANSTS